MELNEDKILDFLDGGLSGSEEEELLHRLAVSPERRVVLKQHLQLRELSAILAKKHNYMVPKLLTAQIFTNLSANGYAGPMYHAATDTDALRASLENEVNRSAQTIVEEKRGFRTSSLIFSSVLSFLAGAFLVYLLISSPSSTATGLTADRAGSMTGQASRSSADLADNTGSTASAALPTTPTAGTTSTGVATAVNARTHEHRVFSTSSAVVEAGFDASSVAVSVERSSLTPTNIEFSAVDRTIDLGTVPAVVTPASAEAATTEHDIPSFAVNDRSHDLAVNSSSAADDLPIAAVPPAHASQWWNGDGMYSTIEGLHRDKLYFGLEEVKDTLPFIRQTTVSLRSGGGKAPGRTDDFTGSLVEVKLSADIDDWMVAKLSFGQFMPYETEALSIGKNADGVRLLKLVPVLQYKSVVGAELGFRLNVFGAGVEAMGGFLTDMRNGLIPRASVFTSVMLQNNLSLQVGVEGALYTHDIRPSLRNKQTIFAIENPVLTNTMREQESAGFIGPAFELAWHF